MVAHTSGIEGENEGEEEGKLVTINSVWKFWNT